MMWTTATTAAMTAATAAMASTATSEGPGADKQYQAQHQQSAARGPSPQWSAASNAPSSAERAFPSDQCEGTEQKRRRNCPSASHRILFVAPRANVRPKVTTPVEQ